jgi:hypothetical protein
MSEMVKVLYDDYLGQKRPFEGESSKKHKIEGGEDPPKYPPSPPSSSSSTSSDTTSSRKHSHKHKSDIPLPKLDVKFVLPIYDGKVNDDKLDNWIIYMCWSL